MLSSARPGVLEGKNIVKIRLRRKPLESAPWMTMKLCQRGKKLQGIAKEKEAKRRKEYFEGHYERFRHGGPEDKTKPEVKKIPKKPEEKEKKPEKDKKAKTEEESKGKGR